MLNFTLCIVYHFFLLKNSQKAQGGANNWESASADNSFKKFCSQVKRNGSLTEGKKCVGCFISFFKLEKITACMFMCWWDRPHHGIVFLNVYFQNECTLWWWKYSGIRQLQWLHNLVNTLKTTTKIYILMWIDFMVSDISQFLKKIQLKL